MALATRKKPTGKPHRQRNGQHHRHSKTYLKTYWPYLPMLTMVVVALAINSLWSHRGLLGASSDFSSSSLLNYTNAARATDNEIPLTLNAQLAAAAQTKANDMVARNYWAHNTPDGRTPWSFITAAGYDYQLAGENLAYGFTDAADAVTGWMNSPEHRANILNANYQNVGFGVASAPDYQGKGPETVVVAEYGEPAGAVANITFNVSNPTGVAGAQDISQARQEPPSQLVSRIQLLTGGQASWSLFAVSTVASLGVLIFVARHLWWLRRALSRGELFVSRHPWFDVAVVALIMLGFVLSRAGGFIR